MQYVAIIPARYASSRFPGKPLAPICGKPMIQWVYEHTSKAEGLSAVYVATDDERIFNAVASFGGRAMMTSDRHACGTDRLAECAEKLGLSDDDIVVNVQGDEPLIKAEMISDLICAFNDGDVYMATLKKLIAGRQEAENPNVVKVVSDRDGNALYFSRSMIPFPRGGSFPRVYRHIGMYAYRNWFLQKITRLEKTQYEEIELLEQLRVLEHGFKIRCMETLYQTIGVDVPEDIRLVESELQKSGA